MSPSAPPAPVAAYAASWPWRARPHPHTPTTQPTGRRRTAAGRAGADRFGNDGRARAVAAGRGGDAAVSMGTILHANALRLPLAGASVDAAVTGPPSAVDAQRFELRLEAIMGDQSRGPCQRLPRCIVVQVSRACRQIAYSRAFLARSG
jgi:hypothetical protein